MTNPLLSQTKAADAVAEIAQSPQEFFSNIDWASYWKMALDWAVTSTPKTLLALITIFVGFQIVKWVLKALRVAMTKARMEVALQHFLSSFINAALKVLVVLLALNVLGVPMTTFLAVLGAAGLAIGLSLKDSLSNIAGGLILLVFKPIKLGDLVTVGSHHGFVKEIRIFYTILETKNLETVTIPNGDLANDEIVNFSATPLIRVQALIGIGYEDDIQQARGIMLAQTEKDERIVRDPEPFVVLKELGDSSVNLELRCWCDNKVYRRVLFELYENIKIAFDEAGISIPYPQTDLHMIPRDSE